MYNAAVATDKYLLIEHLLDGAPLADRLRHWQGAGVPASAMARLLTSETGVALAGETVRQWLRRLEPAA